MGKKVQHKPKGVQGQPVEIGKVAGIPIPSSKNALSIAAVLAALYLGWRLTVSVVYLNPSDESLKDVFFGRDPWLILCGSPSDNVDSVFEGTSRKLKGIKFGVLDCSEPLPSKKTTLERLKLSQNGGPVLFFTGYGRDPKQ